MLMLWFFIMIIMMILNSSIVIYFLYNLKEDPVSYSFVAGLNIVAVIGEIISLFDIINRI
jgi:hypothetical protein